MKYEYVLDNSYSYFIASRDGVVLLWSVVCSIGGLFMNENKHGFPMKLACSFLTIACLVILHGDDGYEIILDLWPYGAQKFAYYYYF